ncbi:metal ABC transporter solute-binding protein, Zn/Mn family [Alicyclobacillus contaminans]|uniref:metal ABC transporter solute-binding protein, Zn/Mn family n=1 Tax=Alicyclobacillus contaminans TaxID=392016 RepID=UPI001FE04628|nr:zinc ABC transporter substrate-binding protein [Alicyclobacillus contaminans]
MVGFVAFQPIFRRTKNPHLWYLPNTMPRVAQLIANALAKQAPAHASYFQQQLKTFDQSLQTWDQALARVKQTLAHTPVAVTEPVADYLLQAAGMDIKTPWSFEAAVMNDVDPSPQDVAKQENLFKQHAVKVFVYHQQAMDDVTIALSTPITQFTPTPPCWFCSDLCLRWTGLWSRVWFWPVVWPS